MILHQKLGNWFKVVELLKSSSSLLGISGLTMNLAWQGIGDHFLDNQQWYKAHDIIIFKYILIQLLGDLMILYSVLGTWRLNIT